MTPALLLLGCLSAQANAPTDASNIAIIPPSTDNPGAVDAQLRAAAARVDGVNVLELTKTVAELKSAAELGIACTPEDADCLGRLSAFFRVKMVIVPKADDDKVQLQAFDPKTGGRVNVLEHALPPEGPQRLARLQRSIELLLFPERQLGTLVVRTNPNAQVSLDGAEPMPGPTARFDAVRAGPHSVSVTRDVQRIDRRVSVEAGELKTLDVLLNDEREPTGGAPLWPGLAVAGGGAVLAIVGGVIAGGSAAALSDTTDNPVQGNEARDGVLQVGQAGLIIAGVGVAAVVVGSVMTTLAALE